jgi:hypothetical protein
MHADIDMAIAVLIDPYSGSTNEEVLINTSVKKMGLWSCEINDPNPQK